MSYKHYVTYICCVILNNIQILFQASRTCIHIHEWIVFGHLLLRITIQWHHLDSTLRRGARGSSLLWWDFSSSDLGLSRSNPRAACFLFKIYGCVNVGVCTYSPTSIGSLFLFSFCFQLFPRLWFHLLPRRLVLNFTQGSSVTSGDLIQNLESAHTKYLCSTPTHTPFWSKCWRQYWFLSKFASVPEALKTYNLWRSLLCEVVPLSTTATWRLSSLPAQYLSILRTERVER